MTNMPDFSARNVAKFVVKSAIGARTAVFAAETIADHTEFEKDDFVVETSSTVIGWYVSSKLQPYTDKAVDKTADFIAVKRANRQAKKAEKLTAE